MARPKNEAEVKPAYDARLNADEIKAVDQIATGWGFSASPTFELFKEWAHGLWAFNVKGRIKTIAFVRSVDAIAEGPNFAGVLLTPETYNALVSFQNVGIPAFILLRENNGEVWGVGFDHVYPQFVIEGKAVKVSVSASQFTRIKLT